MNIDSACRLASVSYFLDKTLSLRKCGCSQKLSFLLNERLDRLIGLTNTLVHRNVGTEEPH